MSLSPAMTAICDRQRRLDAILSSVRELRPRSLSKRVRSLFCAADLFAPELVSSDNFHTFRALAEQHWRRPLWRWKGEEGLVGLLKHLLVTVRYPMPGFLLRPLPAELRRPRYGWMLHQRTSDTERLALLAHLGAGGSTREACAKGLLPSGMTRRMQHALLTLSEPMVLSRAIRAAQLAVLGGSDGLLDILMNTRLAGIQDDEPSWAPVLGWLSEGSTGVGAESIRQLVDYLLTLPRKERMTLTRQPLTVGLRRSQRWHEAQPNLRYYGRSGSWSSGPLPASQIPDGTFNEVWTIRQIRTGGELAAEGRELRHCVATYWSSVMARQCAIFSLRQDGVRRITVEVRLASASIVQAKGLCNRRPTSAERGILAQWADENQLTLHST